MAKYILSSVESLEQRLATDCAHMRLVCVDVFDTLLERVIEPPEAVKLTVAARLASEFAAHGLTAEMILEARSRSERELRRAAQEAGFDHECKFSDIARATADRLLPGTGFAARFIEHELRAEKEALYPKAGAEKMLAAARRHGKRVVAISDMYLDGAYLSELLDHYGLLKYIDRVYVSSDVGFGKYSGKLFQHVLTEENESPGFVMHLGDNLHSDFLVPKSLGIRAFHLRDNVNLKRRQSGHLLRWMGKRNSYWRGEHLLSLIPKPESGDFYYRYGYSSLGPVFCGFMHGVLEEIDKLGLEKIFFLAREGHLFRELYLKMAPVMASRMLPQTYLYVSRKVTLLPAAWDGLSASLLNIALCNPKQKGLQSVAALFAIPVERFSGVAARLGLKNLSEPIRNTREGMARFLEDSEFQQIIMSHASAARVLLRRYLDQEGFFAGGHVGLIDIGWSGTIQSAIRDSFAKDADYPKLTGIYLGFTAGLEYGFTCDDVSGVLYDRFTSDPVENVFSLFAELFENSARAFHGSTVGYLQDPESGKVSPVLSADSSIDRKVEAAFDEQAAKLCSGIMDFAQGYIKAVQLTGYRFEDVKPAILAVAERCVVYPTHEETEHFLTLAHAENMGSENIMDFSRYRLDGPVSLIRPRRFYRILRSSHWKYGTLKTLRLPGLNHAARRLESLYRRLHSKGQPAERISKPTWRERLLLLSVRAGMFVPLNLIRKLVLRAGLKRLRV